MTRPPRQPAAVANGTGGHGIDDCLAVRPTPVLPSEASVLDTLRLDHPRLLLLPDDLARIRHLIGPDSEGGDATARRYYAGLRAMGTALLEAPPLERVLVGPRPELLFVARSAIERVSALGLLFQVEQDERWLTRAVVELRALAAFADWHPSHFLDVAEMSHAIAIGYDWLYAALSTADRMALKSALVEKGLRPAEHAYRTGASWVTRTNNWNIVCNGGVVVAALAVADEEPALCRALLHQAITAVPRALATYAPDGAWPEGPGYWSYATRYAVLLFAALQSALGTDFGLSNLPGLAQTGVFRLQSAGPTGLLFNFADAHELYEDEPARSRPALFWLARRYGNPLLAQGARAIAAEKVSARDLLWYDPHGLAGDLPLCSEEPLDAMPLDARYQRAHIACFRSSWTDPNALYVGFRGGGNLIGHAHLDGGSFVLDALGQRWACDLGPDHYYLPGYFDFQGQRWTYYRMSTHGHNTLVLNEQQQTPQVEAPLIAFHSSAQAGWAIADLSAAYAQAGASRVWRGVALLDQRRRVLIQDEVTAVQPVDVRWSMHTRATIALSPAGDRAVLTQGGVALEACLLAPSGARFEAEEVNLRPPQKPSPGIHKLLIHLPPLELEVRLAVLFTPLSASSPLPSTLVRGGGVSAGRTDEGLLIPLERWLMP